MKAGKLAVMVITTTAVTLALSLLALTFMSAEPVDPREAAPYLAWLAFSQLLVFMLPLTFALEPNPGSLRGLYFVVPSSVALIWTLLDGWQRFQVHVVAALIGLCAALCWTALLRQLRPWKEVDA